MSSPYSKPPKQKKVSKRPKNRLKTAVSSDEPSAPQPRLVQAKRNTPTALIVPQPKRSTPNFFPGPEKEEVSARNKNPEGCKKRHPVRFAAAVPLRRSTGKAHMPPEKEEVPKQPNQTEVKAAPVQNNGEAESSKSVKKAPRKPTRLLEPITPKADATIQEFMDYHTVIEKLAEDWEQLDAATALDEKKHLVCCQNKDRNRYPDEVYCLDATRIILATENGTEGPFYHANKCCFEGTDRGYIVAQAPMQNTAEELWKMIFQEQSPTIVMLCEFYENGKEASEPFWPTKTGEYKYFGTMFVNCKKKETKDKTTSYTIEVLPDGCSNSLITVIHHYILWKPNEPVAHSADLLALRRAIKAGEAGPMTVVSSRGTGRAACFTLIDVVLVRLLKGVQTRLLDTVRELRKQRAQSIYDTLMVVFNYLRKKTKKHHEAVQKYHTALLLNGKEDKGCCEKGTDKEMAEKDEKEEKPDEDG